MPHPPGRLSNKCTVKHNYINVIATEMTLPVVVWPHSILQTQHTFLELENTLVWVEKDHKDSVPNVCKVKVIFNIIVCTCCAILKL